MKDVIQGHPGGTATDKDVIQGHPGGTVTDITITDKLLHSAKSAFIKYEQLLEEENKLKSEESEKTKVS